MPVNVYHDFCEYMYLCDHRVGTLAVFFRILENFIHGVRLRLNITVFYCPYRYFFRGMLNYIKLTQH